MVVVPKIALPHLIVALTEEIERQLEIGARPEDERPDGYDGNDVGLFNMGLEAVTHAFEIGTEEVDISGKPQWFMVLPVRQYMEAKAASLTADESRALELAIANANVR